MARPSDAASSPPRGDSTAVTTPGILSDVRVLKGFAFLFANLAATPRRAIAQLAVSVDLTAINASVGPRVLQHACFPTFHNSPTEFRPVVVSRCLTGSWYFASTEERPFKSPPARSPPPPTAQAPSQQRGRHHPRSKNRLTGENHRTAKLSQKMPAAILPDRLAHFRAEFPGAIGDDVPQGSQRARRNRF